MPTIEELINVARQQEKDLQFMEFTSETALDIGLSLIERARNENWTLAVDIRRNGHQLFHYCSEGTSPDNDEWLKYKTNTVNRFNVSSYLWGLQLRQRNQTLQSMGLSPAEYAPWAGGFPVTIRNVGVVGSIAVSGIPGNGDHDVIVWAIEKVIYK
jgi:uncharacterized protein (UPF0303 family)